MPSERPPEIWWCRMSNIYRLVKDVANLPSECWMITGESEVCSCDDKPCDAVRGQIVWEGEKSSTGTSLTPTLDKIAEVQERSQAIGEFLDWLAEQRIELCRWEEGQEYPRPLGKSTGALLHGFFGIDEQAEENERRALIEQARAKCDAKTGQEMVCQTR